MLYHLLTPLSDGGDVCMVKGSLGMAMRLVVDEIKALGNARDARARDEE